MDKKNMVIFLGVFCLMLVVLSEINKTKKVEDPKKEAIKKEFLKYQASPSVVKFLEQPDTKMFLVKLHGKRLHIAKTLKTYIESFPASRFGGETQKQKYESEVLKTLKESLQTQYPDQSEYHYPAGIGTNLVNFAGPLTNKTFGDLGIIQHALQIYTNPEGYVKVFRTYTNDEIERSLVIRIHEAKSYPEALKYYTSLENYLAQVLAYTNEDVMEMEVTPWEEKLEKDFVTKMVVEKAERLIKDQVNK
jgi:hypothetical protein